jgi:hypothetical protein
MSARVRWVVHGAVLLVVLGFAAFFWINANLTQVTVEEGLDLRSAFHTQCTRTPKGCGYLPNYGAPLHDGGYGWDSAAYTPLVFRYPVVMQAQV